jgi:replicative DNA helicase
MAKSITPPTAPEAEDCLIGLIITDPKYYKVAEQYITSEDVFWQDRTKILWRKIRQRVMQDKLYDMVTLCSDLNENELNEGINPYYITGLTEIATKCGNAEEYAKIIYKKYLLRKLIYETHAIQDTAYTANGNAYEVLNNTHTTIGELIQLKPGQKFKIEDQMSETLENINQSNTNILDTGYDCIKKMCGGLTRGEITIIGGRPGHGKTTLSLNLVSNMIKKGYKVIVFNREMSNTEMLKKLLILESQKLSYKMVRQSLVGDLTIVAELERTKKKICELYNSEKFLMFDNIKDFGRAAAEVKKFKPDVVFDDYVQLIKAEDSISERRLQLEDVIHNYKWLAKSEQCAVVAVSQLNRALETRGDGKPRLSDIAESGALEQVAENVFFVYYDYKINGAAGLHKGYGPFTLELIASKVRYGDGGSYKFHYEGDKVKISEKKERY